MKHFTTTLIGILIGILAAGILFLVTTQPQGEAITLLPPPTPAPIAIHISGGVVSPGVYTLPHGSRVQDAVDAAGGVASNAEASRINLAAPLEDGQQIIVPTIAPTRDPFLIGGSTPQPIAALININTADLEQLDALPGIGPVTAQNIIDYRNTNGPFLAIEDIMQVPRIGQSLFDKIKDLITVDG
jgi:competence protein ComEA